MNDSDIFVTVTGLRFYYETRPFRIGTIVLLRKDPNNRNDPEAIAVEMPFANKVAYLANSVNTVIQGTFSAGRLYDRFDTYCYGEVRFITPSAVICRVHLTDPDGSLERRMRENPWRPSTTEEPPSSHEN